MFSMTAWADYAAGQLAVAEIDLECTESAMRQLREEHLVRTWEGEQDDTDSKGKRKGVTVRKAELFAEDGYRKGEECRLEAYARKRLLTARYESFVRREALASRELTRRTGREGPQRRSARLGT